MVVQGMFLHSMKEGTMLHLFLMLSGLVTPPVTAAPEPAMPRGYSIPIVDLDNDADRHVTVDREAGQYLGHPTTHLLKDGKTIIVVYPKGHGRGAIVMKRSNDAGLTWGDRLETPESWESSREVPTIFPCTGRDGSERLLLFSGLYPIRMASSDDAGETWSPLEPLGTYGGIVAMSDCIEFDDGRVMCFFHDDGRFIAGSGKAAGRFNVYAVTSVDSGLTWSDPEVIATDDALHLCEAGVVRSPDGTELLLLLRENSRARNSFMVRSADKGLTWSDPVELPGALTGDRHQVVHVPDGRLFISFRDTTHESSTQGDWVGWVGTWQDILEGREGQYRVRLKDNYHRWDCAYPALELLPDGTIVATTYGHWTQGEPPWILSMRFTLDELDAKLRAAQAEVPES
jgi:hypothetical protein